MTFLVLLAVAGLLASAIGTWILVAIVAMVTLPVYLMAAIWNGAGFGSAIGPVLMGMAVLQTSYGAGMLLQATFRPRGKMPFDIADLEGRPVKPRVFGVWLPLFAFYEVPCQADGSPWDGAEDPYYRVTILVLGWFGSALSMTVGKPRSRSASHAPT